MNLLERRRAIMQRHGEPEHWDFIWHAQADGTIPPRNLATTADTKDWWIVLPGQTVTVAWDMTGFDGNANRRLLQSTSPLSPSGIVYEKDLTETKGEMTFKNTSSKQTSATFLISRSWEDRSGPRFKGRYIKIRINPLD